MHRLPLSIEELGSLGEHHFSDQVVELERLKASFALFSFKDRQVPEVGASRHAFIQQHIHFKLQHSVKPLSDEALRRLGALHFSEQVKELPRFLGVSFQPVFNQCSTSFEPYPGAYVAVVRINLGSNGSFTLFLQIS